MTTLFRNKRDGWWKLRDLLKERQSFHNSTNSFRGGDIWNGRYGQLPQSWATMLKEMAVDYVIYSYSTPIAWHVCQGEDGKPTDYWVIPTVKYSVTTTNHQNIATAAIDQLYPQC